MVVYHRACTPEHPGSHFASKVYVRALDLYCWYDGLEEPQLKISTLRVKSWGRIRPCQCTVQTSYLLVIHMVLILY